MDKLVIRVAEQNLSKIKELVKQGYDLNAPYNEHGFTPFTLAVAQKFQVSFINELIKLGGDVNQPIKDGRTPLMLSCLSRKYPNVLKLLIQYGADVNAQDKKGYTALMQVLRLNDLSDKKAFIKTLIDNGADLTKLKNIQGKTALDIILDRI
jgi:ankyrin repeat protein